MCGSCPCGASDGGSGLPVVVAAAVLVAAGATAVAAFLASVAAAVLVAAGVLSAAGAVAFVVLHRGARGGLWHPAAEPPAVLVARALEVRRLAAIEGGPELPVLVGGYGKTPELARSRRLILARLGDGGEVVMQDGKAAGDEPGTIWSFIRREGVRAVAVQFAAERREVIEAERQIRAQRRAGADQRDGSE
jgi:hypothetical protein